VEGQGGLGDRIILDRPLRGYRFLKDIKSTVNAWASTYIDISHYQRPVDGINFDTFFEMVTGDLTVVSYEDDNFNRLRTEVAADAAETVPGEINSATLPHMWAYQNEHTDPRFIPNYLDRFPIDLTDDSGNGSWDHNDPTNPTGTIPEVDNKLWAPHSVALINLNTGSEYVRAAVFYAPVNVSYLCEGAVTHSQYNPWHTNTSQIRYYTEPSLRDGVNVDMVDDIWRVDRGVGRSSIGVRGPCFDPALMTENGAPDTLQTRRFMSLRDAVLLAEDYTDYLAGNGNYSVADDIFNFHDFKTYPAAPSL